MEIINEEKLVEELLLLARYLRSRRLNKFSILFLLNRRIQFIEHDTTMSLILNKIEKERK